jgi:hypothetical protein
MSHGNKFLILSLLVSLLGCICAWTQEREPEKNRRHASGYAEAVRADRLSDLAKENLERVAASSSQLQMVLVKDPGILVELKRWVAKEATDSGQVVDDNALTDQAIFDRLDRDIGFRSVATKLVQRYGYLLPTLNPDSQAAKEQDIILRQRARRQVQLEEQEDTGTQTFQQGERYQQSQEPNTERAACDSRTRSGCSPPTSNRRRSDNSLPDETPETGPSTPILPEQRSPSDAMRTIRSASASRDGLGTAEYGSDSGISLAADVSRQSSFSTFGGPSSGMPSSGNSGSSIDDVDSLLRQRSEDDLSSLAAGVRSDSLSSTGRVQNRTFRVQDESASPGSTRLAPVTMVH